MQFPESWLREFCNPDISTEQLANVLTMAGLEVEELRPLAPPFSGVVVGEITEAQQHPNADRLRVCKVDVGQPQLLNIVCGAPNARVGIRVPCALVGAQLLPTEDGKPFTIKLGKLRGVASEGMLCSARELHLTEDHAGLLELASDAPLGSDIRAYLALDDTIFTLKLTPNLAHCLSVYGVAREVAALTGAALHVPTFATVNVSVGEVLPVKIVAAELCGRFSGRVIRHLNTRAATPTWMTDRLLRCGQRSVSALVDISNYVMFEFGRPSHIFDLDKIHGGLEVRWGRPGEQLKLLNGSTVTVDENVGVIADNVQVESLAGIMGGYATAVSDSTQNVYVEAAFWWPRAIAGRSRRFNFSTDAGHRFERGVDPATTVVHIERITQLILAICGTAQATCGPIDDQQVNVPTPARVSLRVARAAKVIGMPLSQIQCAQAMERLGLQIEQRPGVIDVIAPSYRFDLLIEEDLIEEVARLVGYDQLPHTPPLAPVTTKDSPENRRSAFAVRRVLADLGYQETINFSFVDERWERELSGNALPVRLLNPIASQMGVMRSSLMGSLLQVLSFNQARRATRVRVFELGRVFMHDASVLDTDTTVQGFHQPMRVAALASGAVDTLQWGRKDHIADFFDAKGDVEALLAPLHAQFEVAVHPAMHPGRCARVSLAGQPIGYVGELHPKWCQSYGFTHAPVLFELDLEPVLARHVPVFLPVPKFPVVHRDVAVVAGPEVTHASLMAAIHAAPTAGLLKSADLFDVYRPAPGPQAAVELAPSERSLAVRLTLGSDDATLTEEQIEAAVDATVRQLEVVLGVRRRA
jgi:phenylalanyl-tRNA synthetase beta chain